MDHSTRAPLRLHDLKPGAYRIRRRRDGPWIAARLTIDNGTIVVTEEEVVVLCDLPADGVEAVVIDATIEGRAFNHPLVRLLYFGVPITESVYAHMLATAAWAKQHAQNHPAAHPDLPIDMNTIPIEHLF